MPDTSARTLLALVALPLSTACQTPSTTPERPATTAAAPASASVEPEPAAPSTAPPDTAAAAAPPRINFDLDATDAAPTGFDFGRTGRGAMGRWVVQVDPTAPSAPNVLAQLDPDTTNFRFPVAVASAPKLADLRVRVRCKPISGKVDQACGLVARYQDQDNYLVTRANALEDNIRLYTVHEGSRHEIASYDGRVTPNEWHDYRMEVRGDRVTVFWDGEQVLDHHDSTFMDPGLAGVWTKADSVTYFDDLELGAL